MKMLFVVVLLLVPFTLGMANCGGGFTQAQVDMAAKRAGDIAFEKAHAETKKKLIEVYTKLGATPADAAAKAELDAVAAGDAARALAEAATKKAIPVSEPSSGSAGLLGILGTALLNIGLGYVQARASGGRS
jgi:uncharacterized membrane protein YqiK